MVTIHEATSPEISSKLEGVNYHVYLQFRIYQMKEVVPAEADSNYDE